MPKDFRVDDCVAPLKGLRVHILGWGSMLLYCSSFVQAVGTPVPLFRGGGCRAGGSHGFYDHCRVKGGLRASSLIGGPSSKTARYLDAQLT